MTWAGRWMPVLGLVRDRLVADGSVRGRRIAVIQRAELAAMLADAGAHVEVFASADEAAASRPDAVIDAAADSRYGTGQSAVNAVLDRTNLLAADKDVVVVGYGRVGKGIAARARGLAARVTVCETDPVAALEAHHDGFDVATLAVACRTADVVFGTLGAEAIAALPHGAILANAGAVEAAETRSARDGVEELVLRDGRTLYSIAPAEEGDPADVVDLNLAAQALSAAYVLQHGREPEPRLLDEEVARLKLEALGLEIDA